MTSAPAASPSRVTQLQRERSWRTWQDDPEAFFADVIKIRHPIRGAIPFKLRPAQREALDLMMGPDDAIILKARQIGMSTLVACYVLWMLLFHPEVVIILLSRTERESRKLLAKVKFAYRRLPEWVKKRGPQLLNSTQLVMLFDNDSMVEAMPSTEDPARGETVTLVVCDEWAFFANPEEAWASIEPITDIGGKVVGLSTANGLNYFHDLWQGAVAGTNGFVSLFMHWNSVPERDGAWYDRKATRLEPWQLHQEYPSDPDEAFVRSGNPVFGREVIDAHIPRDPHFRGRVELLESGSFNFHREDAGALQIWRDPIPGVRYVMGVDVAEGLEHGDFSVIEVLSVTTGEQVAEVRVHTDPDRLALDWIIPIGFWFNTAFVGVESNNHGLTTLTTLLKESYPNLYYRRTFDERNQKATRKIGWYTDRRSKPLMIDELRACIRPNEHNEVAIALRSTMALREVLAYRRQPDGKMGGQPFDDMVMALAIAAMMRAHVVNFPDDVYVASKVILEWNTPEYWRREWEAESSRVGLMGRHLERSGR